jgi:hypothetical protein
MSKNDIKWLAQPSEESVNWIGKAVGFRIGIEPSSNYPGLFQFWVWKEPYYKLTTKAVLPKSLYISVDLAKEAAQNFINRVNAFESLQHTPVYQFLNIEDRLQEGDCFLTENGNWEPVSFNEGDTVENIVLHASYKITPSACYSEIRRKVGYITNQGTFTTI